MKCPRKLTNASRGERQRRNQLFSKRCLSPSECPCTATFPPPKMQRGDFTIRVDANKGEHYGSKSAGPLAPLSPPAWEPQEWEHEKALVAAPGASRSSLWRPGCADRDVLAVPRGRR